MRRIARVLYCNIFLISFLGQTTLEVSAQTNHFQFKTPQSLALQLDEGEVSRVALKSARKAWMKAWLQDGSTNFVELGNRVVLQLKNGGDLKRLTQGHPLQLSRSVATNVFILQAPDALTAAQEAQSLAALPEVEASYPVMQTPASLNGAYAAAPNDQYAYLQWNLEHRNGDGTSAGVDLNVRAAWPYSRGEGVTIAVGDLGVELDHPDLTNRAVGGPHFNFAYDTTNVKPFGTSSNWAHGTEVAGLALAEANNSVGVAGVAPKSQLAAWVMITTNLQLITDEKLMDMYQYESNKVSVQNHSWSINGLLTQNGIGPLQETGISNATTFGRDGRGVVIVRAAGNDRQAQASADDDGYPSNPRVIAVGAVRVGGRVASFSEFGASVLLAAPSGDPDNNEYGLFTTDLLGPIGANVVSNAPPYADLWNYEYPATGDLKSGFSGTSASAPQISGVAALILSANTNLTYRDVQQILILSARHFDFADPDLRTNGAGFAVSHNLGFGIPDAGVAVNLARNWTSRPPLSHVTVSATNQCEIPDAGLRVLISGTNIPTTLTSITALAGTGPHPDAPTLNLPLVDIGQSIVISANLTNKGALIERSTRPSPIAFSVTIGQAARAGAAFAVVYNYDPAYSTNSSCGGGDTLCAMAATDFVPIPAVFIGRTDGQSLIGIIKTNPTVLGQISLNSTNYNFNVTETLLCEHVGVRLKTDHPLRGDLRITLVSPQGTRSILQRYNGDLNPGPVDWTYYSTHHFFESSAGTWTLYVSDESAGAAGNVLSASLMIDGVPMNDNDHDGLDDGWEMEHFGNLAYGPKDDPDKDGYNNMREQIMGTDPMAADIPFATDLSRWNSSIIRLSWPGNANYTYQVWGGTNITSLDLLTTLPGRFPETEWFTPSSGSSNRYFRVLATQNP
jgi:subtilisin family serine protease/subtilisin-like proprotein convertase family protein